jgi:dTDP-4-dehydrorhamnose reductase
MHVLIFGGTGQVARELASWNWPQDISIAQLDRDHCELSSTQSVNDAIELVNPDLVINAAAYTAVDRAESEPLLAERVNRDAPEAMALACARRGATLIHLSTDYVFDGTKTQPYLEDDPVGPISVYGRTKEAGEAAVRAALDHHVIIRTSWVFSAHGNNFVKTMLRLGATRPELRVVADQNGAPTSARDIAGAIAAVTGAVQRDRGVWGTFHFSSDAPTTWHGFAREIFAGTDHGPVVTPITTAEYPTPARRPSNSVLDCSKIRHAYGVAQPTWQRALRETLSELKAGVNP